MLRKFCRSQPSAGGGRKEQAIMRWLPTKRPWFRKRFSPNPDVAKNRVVFERAQKAEEISMGVISLFDSQLCGPWSSLQCFDITRVMRTVASLSAFFLLICLAPRLNAQDLQVIKDSEAIQYVGKNVEVRGLVVAVYTSKKGNTFLNFGAKYQNQTFTGYIPAGSELSGDQWTVTVQGKVIGITGTVEMYQGKPEVKIQSRSQIHE
jgi:hypothetical protein